MKIFTFFPLSLIMNPRPGEGFIITFFFFFDAHADMHIRPLTSAVLVAGRRCFSKTPLRLLATREQRLQNFSGLFYSLVSGDINPPYNYSLPPQEGKQTHTPAFIYVKI